MKDIMKTSLDINKKFVDSKSESELDEIMKEFDNYTISSEALARHKIRSENDVKRIEQMKKDTEDGIYNGVIEEFDSYEDIEIKVGEVIFQNLIDILKTVDNTVDFTKAKNLIFKK